MIDERHHIVCGDSVSQLLEAEKNYLAGISPAKYVFKRYFISDETQVPALDCRIGAVSVICQPPLGGASVAVWIYSVAGAEVEYCEGRTLVRHDGLEQIWDAAMVSPGRNSEEQTRGILESFEKCLDADGLTLADNCIRTWFFCHDIDNNYAGLVKGRRDNFTGQGLTEKTHYIASTGIAGSSPFPGALVQMDALSFKGLPEKAMNFLYAPEFLNPTYEYGVTFERGVRVNYASRDHLFISGTASINNKGEVMFVGDVAAQTERMWANVDALLQEGGCGWKDVRQALVYLRNPQDYEAVAPMFVDRFGHGFPVVFLHAPVCRPDWLIEMECIAIK
ncbi:MAG: Rid family hydrolase [Bacteroidales bacterium]|nr:Rid family hydrolase [Bacteroidales bacterium]